MKKSFRLIVAFALMGAQSFAQNVGIGTNTPISKLDINGGISLREGPVLTLANGGAQGGVNDNVALPDITTGVKAGFYRIAGPTAAFSLYGIVPNTGADGQLVTLVNTTTNIMTIKNGGSSIATNGFTTLTGSDMVSVAGNSSITIQYNKTAAHWYIVSSQNYTVTTGSVATGDITTSNSAITLTNNTGRLVGTSTMTLDVKQNDLNQKGIVAAPTGGNNNQVYGTDNTGAPAWLKVNNTMLANNSVTVNTGTGLSGGGTVALGGTLNLSNIGGTITNIATGTGLTGGPITSSGTIALANTAVTPGTYTSTNLTVDAQGRITAAGNGTGGTVTGVTASNGLNGTPSGTTVDVALGGTLAANTDVALNSKNLTFSGTGNVGIGTAAPQHQFSVGTTSSDGQLVTVRGYSNTPVSWKGGAAFGYTSATVIMGELGGVATIGGHNGTISAWANLAINSGGGNVGIGTPSPSAILDVNGSTRIRTLTAGYVKSDASGNLSNGAIAVGDIPAGSGNYIQNQFSAAQTAELYISGRGRFQKSIYVSMDNTTGGGIVLSDDGDIVDNNDGFASHRFSYGIRVMNGNGVAGTGVAAQIASNGTNATYFNAGNVGVGNIAPQHLLSVGAATSDGQLVTLRSYSNTPASWKGGGAFGYTSATVIMGELGGVATIGGHNGTLGAWANLAINSGGGNVGIGTTSPQGLLDVNGRAGATSLKVGSTFADLVNNAPWYGIGMSNTTLTGQGSTAVQVGGYYGLTFVESGATRMVINQGNVGIGTSAPNDKLEVYSGDGDAIVMGQVNGNNTNTIQTYIDGHWSDRATYAGGCCNALLLQPDVGVVGIRTTGPTAVLDVNGSTRIRALGAGYVKSDGSGNLSSGTIAAADLSLAISGTTNYISKFTGANTIGNSQLFDNGTSVGIGNASPSYKLDVIGDTRHYGLMTISRDNQSECCSSGNYTLALSEATASTGRVPTIEFHAAGYHEGYIKLLGSQGGQRRFQIGDNQGAGMGVQMSGPVYVDGTQTSSYIMGTTGIGTSSPSAKLHVVGSTSGVTDWGILTLGEANGNNATQRGISFGYDAGNEWAWMYARTVGCCGRTININNTAYVQSGGNLGVGTSGPNSKLELYSGNGDAIVMGQVHGDNTNTIQTYIDGHWSDRATYAGGCCNALLIEPDIGNIGIGTTGPGYKLHVEYTGTSIGFYVNNGNGSGTAIYANNPASEAGSGWGLYTNGDMGFAGTLYGPSDRRLKKDIQDYTGALGSVMKLNVKTYRFDTAKYPNAGFDDRLRYGFIAQELEEVFPNSVKEKKLMNVDSTQTFKNVDYMSLIPVLTQAIKEQQKQMEEMRSEIDELKKKK